MSQMEKKEVNKEKIKVICSNCQEKMFEEKLHLHTAYCKRNIVQCEKCQ